MRPFRLVVAASLSASFALFAPKIALAGSCDNPKSGACINSDTLWPHVGPSHFVSIGGTETIEAGKIGFGVIGDYQSRPIRLQTPSPGPLGTTQNAVNDQVNATFAFEYGITKNLELGVMLPLTLGQGGSGTSAITGGEDIRDTAVRDMRFGFAYSILSPKKVDPAYAGDTRAADGLGLAVRMEMSAPTGDKGQFAGEEGAVYIPSIAADYRLGRFYAAGEAGARLRQTATFLDSRVGSQLAFGLGAGVDVLAHERLSVSAEARILPTLTKQYASSTDASGNTTSVLDGTIAPAEWMLAVRSAPFRGSDFAGQLAGGASIPTAGESAITVPRFRFVLSIVFEPRGLDSDGDGVLDRDDLCPSVAGPRVSEKPGCPPPPPPPPQATPPQDLLSPPPPLPAPAPTTAPAAAPPLSDPTTVPPAANAPMLGR